MCNSHTFPHFFLSLPCLRKSFTKHFLGNLNLANLKEQFKRIELNIFKLTIIKRYLEIRFELFQILLFSFIRFLQLHVLDGGSMLVLSHLLFYKRIFTCILYYILVRRRYSRTRVSHKLYYDQGKRSD